jgi:hypothetical protein
MKVLGEALGREALAAALADGRALTLEQAVSMAVEIPEGGPAVEKGYDES